jgi:hypothetical protein
VNAWQIHHADGRTEPETFATIEEAQAALDEFFTEIADEIATGQRPADNGYDREDFRIVEGGAS